jgi:hypothetical protein
VNATRSANGVAIASGILQVFIGLSGVAGGVGLIAEPSGAFWGLPLEWLSGTPFSSYLVPGVVLLIVVGLGSLLGASATFFRYSYAPEIAIVLGALLIVWIIAQVLWIGPANWLQPFYFVLGALELGLGLLLRRASQPVS